MFQVIESAKRIRCVAEGYRYCPTFHISQMQLIQRRLGPYRTGLRVIRESHKERLADCGDGRLGNLRLSLG
jgi:hypothetical protein